MASLHVDSDGEIHPITYNMHRILQEAEKSMEHKLQAVTAERDYLRQNSVVTKMSAQCAMMQTELAQSRIKRLEFELKIAQEENLQLSQTVWRLKRKIDESEEEKRRHGATQRKHQRQSESINLEDWSESDSSGVNNSTTEDDDDDFEENDH